MNRALETVLIALILPATALAVIVGVEWHRKETHDDGLHPVEGPVTPPKFKIVPKRKH
jgi:hypothetical protein